MSATRPARSPVAFSSIARKASAPGRIRARWFRPRSRYFGALLGERTLMPGDGARLGDVRFQEWLNQGVAHGATGSR